MSMDFRQLSERLERIYSKRFALRPVCLADGWPLFEATRNPSFNKHLLWEQPSAEAQALSRIDAIVEASRRGQMAAVSAVVKHTGEWASLFRFQPYCGDPNAMEMGIWTHDRFWHGRFSFDLARLCVEAAFLNSDAHRLIGAAAPENRASCHLMKAGGMSPTALVTRHDENERAVVLQEYAVTRAEWQACTRRPASFEYFPVAPMWTDAAAPPPRVDIAAALGAPANGSEALLVA